MTLGLGIPIRIGIMALDTMDGIDTTMLITQGSIQECIMEETIIITMMDLLAIVDES